jgi:transcriptional regulator
VVHPVGMLTDLAAAYPATLVSIGQDGFRVSILPMLFYPDEGPAGVLRAHLARGNPHWRELEASGSAVAIFNGAEAYVTPSWYAEKRRTGKVVPTWNYSQVIVHGSVNVHHEAGWLIAHVRRLVERHEAGRAERWSVDDAPAGYIETQARAIVGLEMVVARIEAKRKLSQNRSAEDVRGVINALAAGTPLERLVAADMEEE